MLEGTLYAPGPPSGVAVAGVAAAERAVTGAERARRTARTESGEQCVPRRASQSCTRPEEGGKEGGKGCGGREAKGAAEGEAEGAEGGRQRVRQRVRQ